MYERASKQTSTNKFSSDTGSLSLEDSAHHTNVCRVLVDPSACRPVPSRRCPVLSMVPVPPAKIDVAHAQAPHPTAIAIFNWPATPARSACRSFSLSLLILPFFFHPSPFESLLSSRKTPISRFASTSLWLVSPGNTAAIAISRGPNKLATMYLGTRNEL